jgi:hypothetical protein
LNTLPLSAGFGGTDGIGLLSQGFSVVLSVTTLAATRLGQKGIGRIRDGIAWFVAGDADDLYAYATAANGAYTLLSATFQLLDIFDVPMSPPYGAVDYVTPVQITQLTAGAKRTVSAQYQFGTAELPVGQYTAKIVLYVRTAEGQSSTITCVCPVRITEDI